ncbi:hypothetical protein FIV00_03920 [Labrenzia sp. THAF82]|uniref:hypothetical protein n=1 Tax=Labrenzia sp. THAF82 TaxID=2587861 RepID=UPI0012681CBF|nr:hypothetical protein [Labrenzia sp. THAF82]QFT29615.1 hypothetical protein FIV00_03920 [Labrenzia sp. THAF82]
MGDIKVPGSGSQASQSGAVPPQGRVITGHFNGKTVDQIVKIGKESDPVGAFRYLFRLAQNKNSEAIEALRGAALTAPLKPQCTFSALAKSAMPAIPAILTELDKSEKLARNAAEQKESDEGGSVRQVGPSLGTRLDRYNALIKLLKSEYRCRTDPLRDDTNLLTGKAKVGEETSLTFSQFHEKLEEKGVAKIAVAWFKVLAECKLRPEERIKQQTEERIKIQTALVKALNKLRKPLIEKLEQVRKSRFSENSTKFFDFLLCLHNTDEKLMLLMCELLLLFPDASMRQCYRLAHTLDAESMRRLKELKQLFENGSPKSLSKAACKLDGEGMGWLKESKKLFPNASFKELFYAASRLDDAAMVRLKELKKLFPNASLIDLVDSVRWLNADHMELLKELKLFIPSQKKLGRVFRIARKHFNKIEIVKELKPNCKGLNIYQLEELLDNIENRIEALKEKKVLSLFCQLFLLFPGEGVQLLLVTVNVLKAEQLERMKELKGLFSYATFRECRGATRQLDADGMGRLIKLRELFPDAHLRELSDATNRFDTEAMVWLITQKRNSPDKTLQQLSNKS